MSDREHAEQDLPDDVARLVDALREPEPVRPAWREALLHEIETLPAPHAAPPAVRAVPWRRRRVPLSPLGLAAAALVCIAIGAAGAMMLGGGRDLAQAPASPPDERAAEVRTVADARPVGAAPGGTGTAVRFVIVAPSASRVSVVGNFNGWNPRASPMERASNGDAWVRDVVLAPGRHVYAFVVDGVIHVDPSAPRAAEDDFGIPSSAIVVQASR